MKTVSYFVIILLLCIAAGCASSRSGKVYSRDQARASHSVYFGTVLQIEEVLIEGSQSGAGALLGGALGAAAGHTIGGGTGRTLATVGGAVGGAVAGSAVEKKATNKTGLEIMVELDNGEIISVVQEKDHVFAVGDRVRILKGPDGTTRVRE